MGNKYCLGNKNHLGIKHTEETKRVIGEASKAMWQDPEKRKKMEMENNHMWTDKPKYGAVHWWLRKVFGKPQTCEHEDCSGKSKTYDWAVLHGKEYERKRENFIRLCRICHSAYDRGINKTIMI